jgi:hypothetical protein
MTLARTDIHGFPQRLALRDGAANAVPCTPAS